MPSGYLTLTLDTTAPEVTLGDAMVVGGVLRVPYRTTEPGVVAATAVDAEGRRSDGRIMPDAVLFQLAGGWTVGTVSLVLCDDVDNEARHEARVMHSVVRVRKTGTPLARPTDGRPTPRYFTELGEHESPPMIRTPGRVPPRR